VWPTSISGVQAGDAVLVYAQLQGGAPFKVSIDGKALAVSDSQLASVERPLLERAWAKARIDSLQAKLAQADGAPEREKLKAEIVDVSTRSRVLSSLTALLVLETEQDYARFKIDRRALADILTVENGQVKRQKRGPETIVAKAPVVPEKPKAPAKPMMKEKEEKKSASKRDDDESSVSGGKDADKSMPMPKPSPAKEVEAEMEESKPSPEPTASQPSPPPPPSPIVARPPPANAGAVAPPRTELPSDSAPRADPASPPARPAVPEKGPDPYVGKFKDVMNALKTDVKKGVALAQGWHEEQPGDLLALVALGEALERSGDQSTAARAYGSIIDLFPARADLRRFAGVRLERLANGLELAADSFAKAAEQRADHPASHRLLAFSLIRANQPEKAFNAIATGIKQTYPGGRFLGVDRILKEDAGLIAAAWIKAEPARKAEITQKLKELGGITENEPSLRFVLNWETDANDVDFHIYDGKGGHAYYSSKQLPSGGELYADVTTGYGPECFTIRLPKGKRATPYTLQAHYYSIGPMGAGMGKLEIIEHDGQGNLKFEQRPYVVMVNQAYVDLGVVK
jgi:hypothetical protein